MDKLKLVKIAVFSLTFLLILGTLTFLGLFFQKTRNVNKLQLPSEISLQEPEGSLIKQIENQNGRLYLLVIGGGENDRVIIFDPASGQKITKLKIN